MTAAVPVTAHLINHTHWDREWFLTSVYTSRWIPRLIDKLEAIAAANPDFRFLFDGQTLVVEDLLATAPTYESRVRALIAAGQLTIGPYYCQPDWQLTGGELLLRNLLYGQQDLQKHGGASNSGWLVDTFGHISQAPQLHRLFGLTAVYVWRGVPQLVPYFQWEGTDGSRLFTINLFGGYRNLYGVTHAPEMAVRRLHAEVAKLKPYYPTTDLPLFDGYDLEDNPEDPLRFYTEEADIGPELVLRESTPTRFAEEMAGEGLHLPVIRGELNSGKYGATFPGTFSARTYLKIMARDCEELLFHRCEPLAVMARLRGRAYSPASYEAWARTLLQNAVHDCICGVSIDQVHEKMEYSYRQVYDAMVAEVKASLAAILAPSAPGTYAVSTVPLAVDQWQVAGAELIHVQTEGIGVWPVRERVPIEQSETAVPTFTWRNDHYTASVERDGRVRVGDSVLGRLVIAAEEGDTYSEEMGPQLGDLLPEGPLVLEQRSERHAVLRFGGAFRAEHGEVTATVRLAFDPSPLIQWQVDLDSRGSDLRVELVFETAVTGTILAGMPFDVVERPAVDTDLLPRQAPAELANLLLGQREVGAVTTFPFHDFVAISGDRGAVAILAKGIHAYAAGEEGTVRLTLRRAVEWLTKADLKDRVGDAGPFFYVPDARCERTVRHEVAVVCSALAGHAMALQRLNEGYRTPPLIVRSRGTGTAQSWRLLAEALPMSALQIADGRVLARFYNPAPEAQPLSQRYRQTDVAGRPQREVSTVAPKAIVTVELAHELPELDAQTAEIELLTALPWRVGANAGRPDPAILAQLEEKIAQLETQLAHVDMQLAHTADETGRLRLQHRHYVLKRERVELQLSLLLNRRKLAEQGTMRYEYLYEADAEIAALGLELNQLRIKRRIFDYVVAALDA